MATVSWLTHYPPRQRRNPWARRFLLGVVPLILFMAWWLRWLPPQREAPEVLLGLPQWSTETNRGGIGGDGTPATDEANGTAVAGDRLPRIPSQVVETMATTSAVPRQFRPMPSLIVASSSSQEWPAKEVKTTLEAQIALARQGLSPGSIDGVDGALTQQAIRAFQGRQGLPTTGKLDLATQNRLLLTEPPYTHHLVTAADLAHLHPLPPTWLGKSELERLDYEDLAELVAEKWQAHPNLIRHKNQDMDWSQVRPGTKLIVPNVRAPMVHERAASLRISLEQRTLEALDNEGRVVVLFPCSIARQVQDRLVGRLHVTRIARNPDYTFDPARFPRSAEARQLTGLLTIPPGPNNPVGTVWIGLDRPGYGIHGTPNPEKVGRAESLGCFRLANWNAELLTELAWVGMPVEVGR